MDDLEFNITVAAMEIASLILSGKMGEDVCERVFEELDINNDEAGCLEQNLEAFLKGEE